MKDIFSIIGEVDCSEKTGYCDSSLLGVSGGIREKRYWHWEVEVAIPAIEKLGYTLLRIYDGERDSFGPLSRVFEVEKDGVKEELFYG